MAHEPPWIDLMSSSTVKSLRKISAVNTCSSGLFLLQEFEKCVLALFRHAIPGHNRTALAFCVQDGLAEL